MTNESFGTQTEPSLPRPNARLRSLDKLLGTWDLKHRAFDSGEEWRGQDTFEWLDGGFFLALRHEEFGKNIKGIMLIGFEQKWGEELPGSEITGHWFESSTGSHYEYVWEADDHTLTFWLGQKGSDAAFHGKFSDDGNTIIGVWQWPGGGYELTMTRLPKDP